MPARQLRDTESSNTNSDDSCSTCGAQFSCFFIKLAEAGGNSVNPLSLVRRSAKSHQIMSTHTGELDELHVVRSGWLAYYVLSPGGRRQITSIVLPGEVAMSCDLFSETPSGSFVALSAAETCALSRKDLTAVLQKSDDPMGVIAMLFSGHAARFCEHLVTLGQRGAEAGLAQLLLDIRERLVAAGADGEGPLTFHLRQQDIADFLGVTQVHVSRIVTSLRERNIVLFAAQTMEVRDLAALRSMAEQY